MNRLPPWGAVACAAALAGASAAAALAAWSTYSNAEFHVAVDTPAPPRVESKVVKRDGGDAPTLSGQLVYGSTVMVFTVSDVSHTAVADNPTAALEQAVAGASRNRTVDSVTSITVNGAPGRYIVAHNDAASLRARIFFSGNRLYAALAGAPAGQEPAAEYTHFANSLRAE